MTRPRVRVWPNRLGADVGLNAEVMVCIGALRATSGIGSKSQRCLVIHDASITASVRADDIAPEKFTDAVARCREIGVEV